jgi:hypothetical protein
MAEHRMVRRIFEWSPMGKEMKRMSKEYLAR